MLVAIPASNDHHLVHAVLQGDHAAFQTLYHRHSPLIYRFAARMSGSETVAEEVTQDVFLVLLEDGAKYSSERSKLSSWLCGIARNLVLKQLEQRGRLIAEPESWEPASTDEDPLAMLSRKEAVAALRDALDRLPPSMKEVIVLCDLEEMTYEDAATVIGVPVGTVRSRLHRAKLQLVKAMSVEAK